MDPESSLPPLPIEVWGRVFEYIENPTDLLKARSVCKLWDQEINRVIPNINWKKPCFQEISTSSLASIAAVVQPTLLKTNYQEIEDQNFWKKVYYHYKKLLKIDRIPKKFMTLDDNILFTSEEYITCFDVRDTWTMIGTNMGRVYVLTDHGSKRVRRSFDLEERIQDVKIWQDTNGKILFVASTQLHSIKVGFPTFRFSLDGHYICTGTVGNLCYMQGDLLIRLQSEPSDIGSALTLRLNFIPHEKIVAICSRELKIFIVVQIESWLRILTVEETFHHERARLQLVSFTEPLSFAVEPSDMHVYAALNGVIVCFENEHMYLYFPETKNFVYYDQSMYFDAMVTSIIIHGMYIIIGFSNGMLSIYDAEGISSLQHSQLFEKEPVKTIKLDVRPIIAIKATDIDGDISITACSQRSMFALTF